MARTITEIKKSLTTEFMKNAVLAKAYGYTVDDDFDAKFSKVSIESILFYIFAVAAYVLEVLFDTHKSEVNEIIDNMIPGTAKWYRDKALDFMLDKTLINGTDEYDTTGMSDADIATAKIVKYAAAIEVPGTSVLILKIAKGDVGSLAPITDTQQTQFESYIQQIKYAGVRFSVVNQVGDDFKCRVVCYYDPILTETDVRADIKEAIKAYIQGLPFNGEYSNMALIDAVQAVNGVKVADFKEASYGSSFVSISEKVVPDAGYFSYVDDNITVELSAYGS